MKKLKTTILSLLMTFVFVGSASAHVVVKPADVTTGTYQTFSVGVPNEKGGNVVMVKLTIPENVTSVTPTEKPGWIIETEKTGEGEEAVVKSITWKGGIIGDGRRDDFSFSAKTPDQAADIQWKAYETYENGVTVAWDKTAAEQPKKADGSPDYSTNGPFSVTKVAPKAAATEVAKEEPTDSSDVIARTLGAAALLVSVVSFALVTRKK